MLKGELYHKLGNILELKGYRVIAFNLVDMDNSDCYNPIDYIRSDNDIIKLVTNMMKNTTPKGASSSDPFWDNALSLYLQAVMSYVWYECPKHGKKANIREMMNLLTKAKVQEKEGVKSELDIMMEVLPDDHPAKVAYLKVRSGAKDTIRSIIISAHARLAYLQNPKVLRILDKDEMNIRALGEGVYENPDRKTALFCIIPDNDMVETSDGYLTVPFEYGGYMMKYENGQAEVLPVYDPFSMTRIHAGGAMLTKIPVCGYYEDEMFTAVTEEEAKELFITLKRMTPAKQNIL